MHLPLILLRASVIAVGAAILFTATAAGESPVVEGFTAPYRVVHIGAPETGVVEELVAREGDRVSKGDVLAKLDCEVHMALLAIAKESMEAEGQLQAARAELELHQRRLDVLTKLHEKGHARQDEVDRALTDREIADANVRSAKEQLLLRKLEYDKIVAQIERRRVRSPLDGVVTSILKQEGEFAAPNNPDLMVLVQLDPLLAEFAATRFQADRLEEGQAVTVAFEDEAVATGTVEFISPVTDAESGTVVVKVRIDNPRGTYRSGERCRLQD